MAAAESIASANFDGHINGTTKSLPIIIAGGGCVGLFLALLLAQSNIPNPIIVIEPAQPDATSTRAMAHQPPTYPILSKVPGLLPEVIKAGSLSSGLCFRTSIAHGSEVIAEKRFDNTGAGMKGKGQLLLPQGKFQAILMSRLATFPAKVTLHLGSRVESFTQDASSVTATILSSSGSSHELEAQYLIGADGAHSSIRKHRAIPFEGETLDAQLVATDLYFDFHAHAFHDANFIIDNQHYGLIGRITGATPTTPALWRVSYGVSPTLSLAEIEETVHEKLAVMLPNVGLDSTGQRNYKLVRIAPYKAQQRCVPSFLHNNNILLIGDAAHLTNPYAGLGLASGIADASSLSSVLIRILNHEARDSDTLLQSWSQSRREVFMERVDRPSRAAYARVKSDVSSEGKREELRCRDGLVGALSKGMPVVPPSLETRGEELEGW